MSSQPESLTLSQPLAQAVKLLNGAAEEKEPDAIFLLAEMSFFGNYTHPRNYKEAFRRYHELASLNGNSSAQHMVGLMYATGFGGAVQRDQAKALTYHTFAAMGDSTRAQMTTAYRHYTGVGAPRNCNEAAYWYKKVADKVIAYSRSGPPGGMLLQKDSYKIADEKGGIYGDGASVVSSGVNANRAGPNSDAHADFDDVLEYLDLMSRKGDLKATFSLGRLHYEGSRTMKRNLRTARAYFMMIARKYWQKDGSIRDEDQALAQVASKAAGYIGRMFLRGEGMEQSYEKALTWFRRGVANGDALCQYKMGLMHIEGLGVKKDPLLAADYFKEAANQNFASAQVNMGQLFLDQGDIHTATRFFELAARNGHIEAFYHLAEINNYGIGQDRSCGMATAYYKTVAEKVESVHSSFDEANRAYDEGDTESALVMYMMAAEQGYESGQANVAYLLDDYKSILSLDSLIPWKKQRSSLLRNAALALIYWTRSAKQQNIDSMVKMGDYYLGGYGVEADMEKAATCYQTAAETHQSAQALWNLGWIHENGLGVEQDFHLAKRFYDQALETNQESYLPVKLSLTKLRMRSFWNTITNGKVKSIQSEPGKPEYFREKTCQSQVLTPFQNPRKNGPSANGSPTSSKTPTLTTTAQTTTTMIPTQKACPAATTTTTPNWTTTSSIPSSSSAWRPRSPSSSTTASNGRRTTGEKWKRNSRAARIIRTSPPSSRSNRPKQKTASRPKSDCRGSRRTGGSFPRLRIRIIRLGSPVVWGIEVSGIMTYRLRLRIRRAIGDMWIGLSITWHIALAFSCLVLSCRSRCL